MEPRKIERMWAFVAEDENGEEGVMGARVNGTMMPLVCADLERVESLREVAVRIGKLSGKAVKLLRFDSMTVEEKDVTVCPKTTTT